MKRLPVFLPAILMSLGLMLAACSQSPAQGSQTASAQPAGAPIQPSAMEATLVLPPNAAPQDAAEAGEAWPDGRPQTSEQGAVTVIVTPLNLNNPAETLEFEVAMDTHSVELDMDLAKLATLAADNGLSVNATTWDAPGGGHHVSGVLYFPSTVDGLPLLEGATTLTLTIQGVDAAERIFIWTTSD